MDEGELTAKEERFCLEYIVDYKPAEAAVRAGYKESSARTQGWRMLKKEAILLRVRELQEEYKAMGRAIPEGCKIGFAKGGDHDSKEYEKGGACYVG